VNVVELSVLRRTAADHDGPFGYHKPLMIAFLSFDTCVVYWRNLAHGGAGQL